MSEPERLDDTADVEEQTIPPLCADVQTWVEHVYVTTFIRTTNATQRWCPSWWAHAEAIVRLTALWQTWETARASDDSAGIADWLRTHLDALNPALLAPDGPFSSCTNDRHNEQAPMPVTAPPPNYWTDR
jgi:Domain of unknown function (DUF4913)